MKTLVLLIALSLTSVAQANTQQINCNFTEPFYNLDIDLKEKTVTRTEPNWESTEEGAPPLVTVIHKDIRIVSISNDPFFSKYQVVTTEGAPVLTLTMNFDGSDGMSDFAYPIAAVDETMTLMHGGCETNLLKRQLFNYDNY